MPRRRESHGPRRRRPRVRADHRLGREYEPDCGGGGIRVPPAGRRRSLRSYEQWSIAGARGCRRSCRRARPRARARASTSSTGFRRTDPWRARARLGSRRSPSLRAPPRKSVATNATAAASRSPWFSSALPSRYCDETSCHRSSRGSGGGDRLVPRRAKRSATGRTPRTAHARTRSAWHNACVVACFARGRDRGVGFGERDAAGCEDQPVRERGERPRPHVGPLGSQPGQSFAHDLGADRVARARPHAQLALVGDAGFREPGRVAGLPRELGGRERALVRGFGEAPDRAVHARSRRGSPRADPGRRRRRCRRLRARVRRSATASSHAMRSRAASRGFARTLDRARRDAGDRGLEVVVREHLDRRAGPRVEQLRDLAVQPNSLVGAELLEQGLAHERVREAQTPRAALDLVDELRGDGFVEPVDRGVLVDLHHRGDETRRRTRVRTPRPCAAGRWSHPESRESRWPTTSRTPSGRPASPGATVPTHTPSTCTSAPVSTRWRSTSVTKNGLPSVSAASRCASSMPGVLERIAARGFEERAHAGFVEAAQRDALGARGPVQVGERAREGMAAIDVGVAVRDEHEDVRVGIEVADDVAEQVHAAGVGPVRVVEQHDDRLRHRPLRWSRSTTASNSSSRSVSGSVAVGGGASGARRASSGTSRASSPPWRATCSTITSSPTLGTIERSSSVHGAWGAATCSSQRPSTTSAPSSWAWPRELRREPGLADARLAREQDRGGAIDLRALPRFGEPEPLVFTRRERELAALPPQRRGKRRRGADRRGPRHLERDDRLGEALQLDLADEHEAELGAAAGEAAHEIVAEDLAAVGRVAQPGRGDDRRAVAVAVFPRDVAGADPDAHLDAAVVARPGGWRGRSPAGSRARRSRPRRWRRTRRGCRRRDP